MGLRYMFTPGAGGGVIPTQAIGRGPEKGWLLGKVRCCFQKEESLSRQTGQPPQVAQPGLLAFRALWFFLPRLSRGMGRGETESWAGELRDFLISSVGQRLE